MLTQTGNKTLAHGQMEINGIRFPIDPQGISINEQNINHQFQTLRTRETSTVRSGHGQITISVHAIFTGLSSRAAGREGSQESSEDRSLGEINNTLMPILYSLKKMPLCFIDNELIRRALPVSQEEDLDGNLVGEVIGAFIKMVNIGTVPGMPNALTAEFQFVWYNHRPFAPRLKFRKHWDDGSNGQGYSAIGSLAKWYSESSSSAPSKTPGTGRAADQTRAHRNRGNFINEYGHPSIAFNATAFNNYTDKIEEARPLLEYLWPHRYENTNPSISANAHRNQTLRNFPPFRLEDFSSATSFSFSVVRPLSEEIVAALAELGLEEGAKEPAKTVAKKKSSALVFQHPIQGGIGNLSSDTKEKRKQSFTNEKGEKDFRYRAHKGADIQVDSRVKNRYQGIGTPIVSTADGVVHYVARNNRKGTGLFVSIKHDLPDGPLWSRYLHLDPDSIPAKIKRGYKVKGGEVIGALGITGINYDRAHLHFELRRGTKTTDGYIKNPLEFIKASEKSVKQAPRLAKAVTTIPVNAAGKLIREKLKAPGADPAGLEQAIRDAVKDKSITTSVAKGFSQLLNLEEEGWVLATSRVTRKRALLNSVLLGVPDDSRQGVPMTMNLGFGTNLVNLPLAGHRFPTIQYVGGQHTAATVSFRCEEREGRNFVAAFTSLNNSSEEAAIHFREFVKQRGIEVRNSMLNGLGLKSVMLESHSIDTIPGSPGSVQLTLRIVDRTLSEQLPPLLTGSAEVEIGDVLLEGLSLMIQDQWIAFDTRTEIVEVPDSLLLKNPFIIKTDQTATAFTGGQRINGLAPDLGIAKGASRRTKIVQSKFEDFIDEYGIANFEAARKLAVRGATANGRAELTNDNVTNFLRDNEVSPRVRLAGEIIAETSLGKGVALETDERSLKKYGFIPGLLILKGHVRARVTLWGRNESDVPTEVKKIVEAFNAVQEAHDGFVMSDLYYLTTGIDVKSERIKLSDYQGSTDARPIKSDRTVPYIAAIALMGDKHIYKGAVRDVRFKAVLHAEIGKIMTILGSKGLNGKVANKKWEALFTLMGDLVEYEPGHEAYPDLALPPNPISNLVVDTLPDFFLFNYSDVNMCHSNLLRLTLGSDLERSPKKRGLAGAKIAIDSAVQGVADLYGGAVAASGAKIRPAHEGKGGIYLTYNDGKHETYGAQDKKHVFGVPLSSSFGELERRPPYPNGGSLTTGSKPAVVETNISVRHQPGFWGLGKRKYKNTKARDYHLQGSVHRAAIEDPNLQSKNQNMVRHLFDADEYKRVFEKFETDYSADHYAVRRSFPTFKVMLIEEDSGPTEAGIISVLTKSAALDDFYGVNAIQEIRIVKNKQAAADTCLISVLDIDGVLYNRSFLPADSEFGKRSLKKNPFEDTIIKEGMKVVVKFGYANDASQLETVFVGQIVTWSGHHSVEIICQSYGTELVAKQFGTDPSENADFWNVTTADLLHDLLDREEVRHFGRWKLSDVTLSGPIFGVEKLRPDGEPKKVWTWKPSVVDDNLFIPSLETYASWWAKLWGDIEYVFWDTNIWACFKEMELRHPGYIASTATYGDGADARLTMFFGQPDMEYLSRPARTVDELRGESIANNAVKSLDRSGVIKVGRYLYEKKIAAKNAARSAALLKKYGGTGLGVQLIDIFSYIPPSANLFYNMDDQWWEGGIEGIVDAGMNNSIASLARDSAVDVAQMRATTNAAQRSLEKIREQQIATKEVAAEPALEVVNNTPAAGDELPESEFDRITYLDYIKAWEDKFIEQQPGDWANVGADVAERLPLDSSNGCPFGYYFDQDISACVLRPELERLAHIEKLKPYTYTRKGIGPTAKRPRGGYLPKSKWHEETVTPDYSAGSIEEFYENRVPPGWDVLQIHYDDLYMAGIDNESKDWREWSGAKRKARNAKAEAARLAASSFVGTPQAADPNFVGPQQAVPASPLPQSAAGPAQITNHKFWKSTQIFQDKRMRPFRNYEMVTSTHDIISNKIRADHRGTYNSIELRYTDNTDVDFNEFSESDGVDLLTITADDNIKDHHIRKGIESWPNCSTTLLGMRYASQLLANSLKDCYKGQLIVIGRPRLKPYDLVWLADSYADMAGPIEVKEVVHTFSSQTGFITEIVPNMLVTVKDEVQVSTADAMGAFFTENLKDYTRGAAIGAALVLTAGVATGAVAGATAAAGGTVAEGAAIVTAGDAFALVGSGFKVGLTGARTAVKTVATVGILTVPDKGIGEAIGSPSETIIGAGIGAASAGLLIMNPIAIGLAVVTAGYLMYKLVEYGATREPLIITPLIKQGKPYTSGIEGMESDGLILSDIFNDDPAKASEARDTFIFKRWRYFGDGIEDSFALIEQGLANFGASL